jgi:hypothetical protein
LYLPQKLFITASASSAVNGRHPFMSIYPSNFQVSVLNILPPSEEINNFLYLV